QAAKKANPGSRELGEPTEHFAKPVLVTEAPSDSLLLWCHPGAIRSLETKKANPKIGLTR
ncbi:MAG: hypothetical protein CVU32_00005, partial [Betaproteobacteria bacterium HGW-Betaproteobacteria-5]